MVLKINGKDIAVDDALKNRTLLYLLREQLGLMGTKRGCGTNDCGACKVLVDGDPQNACALVIRNLRNREILTIEGLSDGIHPHPIQQAFVDAGAVQCGFCTPGMILCAKALLDKNPDPSVSEIKKAINGNLCRCTGYVKIIKAIQLSAERLRDQRDDGGML